MILSKKYVVFLLLLSAQMYSQVTIKGFVKDSLQNPLSYVNIIAKPEGSTKNMAFAITDDVGFYRIKLKKDVKYILTVSYMGFQKQTLSITSTKNNTENFVLKEGENQLEEVVIEAPVTVKEDTISYKIEDFTNGKEHKLKNILKKLPGVEVNKNGQVTVQGKKVNKLLVDGKPFFGGGTKLGVENIPADAVKNVKAIDNYNEVGFLKKVSDSDEMALNIELKEDKKRFVFGDVEAGKGNKKYYKSHANLFYYSPKTKVNFIGNLNNIGEKTFSYKNYLDFNGGINSIFKENFNFRGGDFSQFLESNDIFKSQRQFGALNISRTSSKLDVSGYGIFSKTKSNSLEINRIENTNFIENTQNTTDLTNVLGTGKFNLDYKPSNREQWYFKTQLKNTKNDKMNKILSAVLPNENHINTQKKGTKFLVNQNIEWHNDFSESHIFSAISNYTYEKTNPKTFWETNRPILQNIIPIVPQNSFFLLQQKNSEQHYFSTMFKDFWVLNRNNHLYSTIGNSYKEQFFNTKDAQILRNSEVVFPNFGNHFSYNLHDFFIGVHYKFKTGIFTFKQGAHLHRYHWKLLNENRKKWVVLPDFKMDIKFNNSKTIHLNYALKTNFTDVSKYANRFVLRSYNSVFQGNEKLENELYHSARASYLRFSMFRGLTFTLNANYTKKIKGFRNAVKFEGFNKFLTYDLLDNPSEKWSFRGRIKKRIIKNIKGGLSVSYQNSKYKQKIDNHFVTNKNNSYAYKTSAEILFDKFPNIEIGFKQNFGAYTSTNSESKFVTSEPFISVEYDFLKNFQFEFEYSKYIYQQKTLEQENSYELANASLSYHKEDSVWTFKLYGDNLLNATYKQNNSFSDYLISDTKTYILPRVLLFSVGYKL